MYDSTVNGSDGGLLDELSVPMRVNFILYGFDLGEILGIECVEVKFLCEICCELQSESESHEIPEDIIGGDFLP